LPVAGVPTILYTALSHGFGAGGQIAAVDHIRRSEDGAKKRRRMSRRETR
jgi:hypothetical protein